MIVKRRKGISTFIATLLLMVLAVAAGVVIYAYTMGYLGGFGGPQTMGAISIDTYGYTATGLQIFVRNIGKTSFQLQSAYVDGVATVTPQATLSALQITEGNVGSVTLTDPALVDGYTHTVKLIGIDNTQTSFQVKK